MKRLAFLAAPGSPHILSDARIYAPTGPAPSSP